MILDLELSPLIFSVECVTSLLSDDESNNMTHATSMTAGGTPP
jgi:hypothetical protein